MSMPLWSLLVVVVSSPVSVLECSFLRPDFAVGFQLCSFAN